MMTPRMSYQLWWPAGLLRKKKMMLMLPRSMGARRCPFPGIDMECVEGEDGLNGLHFALKFKKLRGDSAAVAELRRGVAIVPTEHADNQSQCSYVIEEDDQLHYEGTLYDVKTVEEDRVAIVRSFGANKTEIWMPRKQVTDLVKQYH